jgi:hypothetical protein
MSYTIKTTMNVVIEEAPGETYPMLLPWNKGLTAEGTTAHIGGGMIPAHANNVKVDLPTITTASTIWFYPDADMDVSLGSTNTGVIHVLAGGCIGFSHAAGPADGALRVTYTGDDPAAYCLVWGGT